MVLVGAMFMCLLAGLQNMECGSKGKRPILKDERFLGDLIVRPPTALGHSVEQLGDKATVGDQSPPGSLLCLHQKKHEVHEVPSRSKAQVTMSPKAGSV